MQRIFGRGTRFTRSSPPFVLGRRATAVRSPPSSLLLRFRPAAGLFQSMSSAMSHSSSAPSSIGAAAAPASSPGQPPIRWEFEDGAPVEPCRPYSDDEWARILQSMQMQPQATGNDASVAATSSSAPAAAPMALLISGLPGSGKFGALEALFALQSESSSNKHDRVPWPRRDQFAVVDFDQLRLFHKQYVEQSHREGTAAVDGAVVRKSFKDLVLWMMTGCEFERVMFRSSVPGRGLIPQLMAARRSFVLEAVLDSEGCFRFVQHLVEAGYRVVFAHVETPLETAIRRAEQRAYATGRWSGREFISSRASGLREWLLPIARLVLEQSSEPKAAEVYVLDNSRENTPPRIVFDSRRSNNDAEQLPPDIRAITSLQRPSELVPGLRPGLMKDRVSDFAMELSSLIVPAHTVCAADAGSFDVMIAGGCFKTLLTGLAPRDVDVFPCSPQDSARLGELLATMPHARRIPNEHSVFQHQWEIMLPENQCALHRTLRAVAGSVPPVFQRSFVLEVALKCTLAGLSERLEQFDLALSAVGVRLRFAAAPVSSSDAATASFEWRAHVDDVYVHHDFVQSLARRQPILLFPLPNAPYLLATAERCVRYAAEMGWDKPQPQLELLLKEYHRMIAQPIETLDWSRSPMHTATRPTSMRDWLQDNYQATTQGDSAQAVVIESFALPITPTQRAADSIGRKVAANDSPRLLPHLLSADLNEAAGSGIPVTLLHTLRELPAGCNPILLLRHAHRPTHSHDATVQLSDQGRMAAFELGQHLVSLQPSLLLSSPWDRCVESIKQICAGAKWPSDGVRQDPLLRPSGPWITDDAQAERAFAELGNAYFNAQIRSAQPPPGASDTLDGVRRLIRLLDDSASSDSSSSSSTSSSSIRVAVTHDSVLVVVLGVLLCRSHDWNRDNWPGFLEGVAMWRRGPHIHIIWRGSKCVMELGAMGM